MKGALYFLGVGILFMILGLVVPFFFAFGVMALLFALLIVILRFVFKNMAKL